MAAKHRGDRLQRDDDLLPSAQELLARKQLETTAAYERATWARCEKDEAVTAVRELLTAFLERVKELGIRPTEWKAIGGVTVTSVQGYPLTDINAQATRAASYYSSSHNRIMVTAPPLRLRRMISQPRRRTFREWRESLLSTTDPPQTVTEVEEQVSRILIAEEKSYGDAAGTSLTLHNPDALKVLTDNVEALPKILESSLIALIA